MGMHVMAFDQTLRNYAYNEATTTTGVLNNQSPCIYAFILDTKNGDLKKKKKKRDTKRSQLLERRADINILLTSIPMISQLLMDVIHESIDVPVDSDLKKGKKKQL